MASFINSPASAGPTKVNATGPHPYTTDNILNVTADLIIRTGLTADAIDSFGFSAVGFIDATGIPKDSTYNGNSVTVTIRNESEEHTITFEPLSNPATGTNVGILTVWSTNLVIPPMGSRTLVFIQTDANKLFIDCIDLFSVTGPRNPATAGDVLTSDANGLTSWTTLAASAAVHIGIDVYGPSSLDVVIGSATDTEGVIAFSELAYGNVTEFTHNTTTGAVTIIIPGLYQISYSTTIQSTNTSGNKTALIEFDLYNGTTIIPGSTTNSTMVTQPGDGYRVTSGKSIIRPLSATNVITVKFKRVIGTGSCSINQNQCSLSLLLIK